MKSRLIGSCIALLGILGVNAQNLKLDWVSQAGSPYNIEYAFEVVSDINGNIYSTGCFYDIVDFDPGPGVFNLESNGERDVFIQKLDSLGNFVWAKNMGGLNHANGFSIAVDHNENVYSTGIYMGDSDFDPGVGVHNLFGYGVADMYVQKLDANGDFVWAHGFYSGVNYGRTIILDENANIYLTGTYIGLTDFDPGPGTVNLDLYGAHDVFVQKLDTDGNLEWVKGFGGTSSEEGYDLVRDDDGNIYVSGRFEGTVDFDPGVNTYNIDAIGSADIFTVKLDSLGEFEWAKTAGGTTYDFSTALTVDGNSDVYTVGRFEGTVDFDPGVGEFNLTSNGTTDGFIQKLDSDGNFIWAIQIGGTNWDIVNSIDIDESDNLYIIGSYSGVVDFDPSTNVEALTANGTGDVFILKLNASGEFIWVEGIGGTGSDNGMSITVDDSRNICISGSFENTVDCDLGVSDVNIISNGYDDIFVCRYTSCETYGVDTQIVNGPFTWVDQEIYSESTTTPKVVLTNVEGCDSIITLNLTVNPLDLSIIVDNGRLASGSYGVEYQWLDCDNGYSPIPGATEQIYIPESNGNYAVELRTINETDTSECAQINNVSLIENDIFSDVSVFLNSNNRVVIQLGELENVSIKVYDICGRRMYTDVHSAKLEIELPHQTGLFFVEVNSKSQKKVFKVLKTL